MTNRWMIAIAAGVFGLTGCASAQAPDLETPGWLEKDYGEFITLFEGRWDSDRHVFFAEDAGMDLEAIAPRQHINIQRQTGSEATGGTTTFLTTRTVDGEPPTELIHQISIDAGRQSIRQSISVPGSGEAATPFGCDIYWQRQGAQFSGQALGDRCDALFPRPDTVGDLSVTMTLSETDFWIQARRGNGLTEARLRRARPFECWTAILRGAEHGDSGEGMSDWDFRRGVTLHDQGGEAVLMTDETPARKVRLRLRNVDWPYGTNRPSLTLYVLEGESDRAVSYAWNEGGAERIGINLRWLQASCTYAPDAS